MEFLIEFSRFQNGTRLFSIRCSPIIIYYSLLICREEKVVVESEGLCAVSFFLNLFSNFQIQSCSKWRMKKKSRDWNFLISEIVCIVESFFINSWIIIKKRINNFSHHKYLLVYKKSLTIPFISICKSNFSETFSKKHTDYELIPPHHPG